jgi:2-keto-4-pentenoate hydratase
VLQKKFNYRKERARASYFLPYYPTQRQKLDKAGTVQGSVQLWHSQMDGSSDALVLNGVDHEHYAYLFLSKREEQKTIDEPGAIEGINNLVDSYAIQNEMLKIKSSLGDPIGWKMGACSTAAQNMLRLSKPFRAPLFGNKFFSAPTTIADASIEHVCLLEAEFLFVLGKSLPARNAPYTAEEAWDAVAYIAPAIEVVGNRIVGKALDASNIYQKVADSGSNVSCVVGTLLPSEIFSKRLNDVAVKFMVNGREVSAGSGANVCGDPINALVLLANELVRDGVSLHPNDWQGGQSGGGPGLAAGEVVMSGAATLIFHGKHFQYGDHVVAGFQGPFGNVEVQIGGNAAKM